MDINIENIIERAVEQTRIKFAMKTILSWILELGYNVEYKEEREMIYRLTDDILQHSNADCGFCEELYEIWKNECCHWCRSNSFMSICSDRNFYTPEAVLDAINRWYKEWLKERSL